MRSILFIPVLSGFLLVQSCNTAGDGISSLTKTDNPQTDIWSGSGKGNYDPVENMYQELAEKDPALRELDKTITGLYAQRQDYLRDYSAYSVKSSAYYMSADAHLHNISDSSLRQRIRALILASSNRYDGHMAGHEAALKKLAASAQQVDDLYNALKIIRTLPAIEAVQKEQVPLLKPLQDMTVQYEQAAHQASALAR